MDSIYYQKKPFNNNKSNNNDEGGPGQWESRAHTIWSISFLAPIPWAAAGRLFAGRQASLTLMHLFIDQELSSMNVIMETPHRSLHRVSIYVQDVFERCKEKAWKKLLK